MTCPARMRASGWPGVRYVSTLLDCIGEMGGGILGGIVYACWPAAEMSIDRKAVMRGKALLSVRELAKRAEDGE